MLSLAESPDTATVSDVAVAGSVKVVSAGRVTSATGLLTNTVTDDDCVLLAALS